MVSKKSIARLLRLLLLFFGAMVVALILITYIPKISLFPPFLAIDF